MDMACFIAFKSGGWSDGFPSEDVGGVNVPCSVVLIDVASSFFPLPPPFLSFAFDD